MPRRFAKIPGQRTVRLIQERHAIHVNAHCPQSPEPTVKLILNQIRRDLDLQCADFDWPDTANVFDHVCAGMLNTHQKMQAPRRGSIELADPLTVHPYGTDVNAGESHYVGYGRLRHPRGVDGHRAIFSSANRLRGIIR